MSDLYKKIFNGIPWVLWSVVPKSPIYKSLHKSQKISILYFEKSVMKLSSSKEEINIVKQAIFVIKKSFHNYIIVLIYVQWSVSKMLEFKYFLSQKVLFK